MGATLFNRISKSRLAWLLGLLLLMPLAQTAATWHLISHIHAQSPLRSAEHSAAYADYCDLCQTAAGTLGGVLSTQSAMRFANAAPLQTPRFQPTLAVSKPFWTPYASRAPPFALN